MSPEQAPERVSSAKALSAPLLVPGKAAAEVSLSSAVFSAETKVHLLHQTVRAELAAARQGTRGAKRRGLVAGGRSKPWRQKGTGRARSGTTRAPQWTGGGVAFPPVMRSFELKVNRRERRAAFAGALSAHARRGSLAIIDGTALVGPSTKNALALLSGWKHELPLLIVAQPEEEVLAKSFRNLPRTLVIRASELEVAALVWARSLLISEVSLPLVQAKAEKSTRKGKSK
ncbi:MAG: 50S ribosomal protein L4 [Gaiellaceae bacterium]|jgi:large subunit ribosomal protein L4